MGGFYLFYINYNKKNKMPVFLTSLFGFLGTSISSVFGFKGEQAKTVQSAIDLLKTVDTNDATSVAASANALSVILSQGSWLEKQWRPMLMIILIVMIGCWFFGLVPPHFNDPVSPMMQQVLDLLKVGVIGYVPCRTIEKVVQQINISSILKQIIAKKIL